ncbi:DUF397 domain-containing protein [Streptomyces sp. RerS4]|uniref:DUF397 domain-containing protein n=1 Tax=Streptomyces sp. RerS4 TaxID=2942449 RepID=UPI00201BF5E1|nr:DUF397 domain-containing protein [Streptomyces sp. RerS4]UQW99118.1 DUF397 domain-containing protein [Streptomyces sp. RerS4]
MNQTPNDLNWIKSSYSDGAGNNCVEIAISASVHIRDSKLNGNADQPCLRVPGAAWTTFVQTVDH